MKENQWHPRSRVSRAKDVMFSQLDEELLAIDSQAGFCYSLNETAGLIWEMMDEPVTIQDICTRLQKKFDVDEKDCLSDVTALLKGLYQAELVKVSHEDKS